MLGDGGLMLGKISKGPGRESLGNSVGYGSSVRVDGLFNPISKFGSPSSPTSAFNSYATKPPKIVYEYGAQLIVVGALTTNKYVAIRGEHIDPRLLQQWLKER